MVNLEIDNDEGTVSDQVNYLENVIRKLEEGFVRGPGWELSGDDEES